MIEGVLITILYRGIYLHVELWNERTMYLRFEVTNMFKCTCILIKYTFLTICSDHRLSAVSLSYKKLFEGNKNVKKYNKHSFVFV